MGTNSGVSWTDHSWGPWAGCNKVRAGCRNCYAERQMNLWGRCFSNVRRASKAMWRQPLARHRDGSYVWKPGERVFVCPWSDFFHPDGDSSRPEAWRIIRLRSDLRWIILTKRVHRIAENLPEDWGDGYPQACLGVSVSTQQDYEEMVPRLLAVPAACHAVSLEPMLERIVVPPVPLIDWFIIGCESGPRRRPTRHTWIEELLEATYGMPRFLKQVAENPDGTGKVLHDSADIAQVFGECPRELPAFFDLKTPISELI